MVYMVPYGPTLGFPLNLLPLDFHSRGIMVYHSYYAGKATKLPISNKIENIFNYDFLLMYQRLVCVNGYSCYSSLQKKIPHHLPKSLVKMFRQFATSEIGHQNSHKKPVSMVMGQHLEGSVGLPHLLNIYIFIIVHTIGFK